MCAVRPGRRAAGRVPRPSPGVPRPAGAGWRTARPGRPRRPRRGRCARSPSASSGAPARERWVRPVSAVVDRAAWHRGSSRTGRPHAFPLGLRRDAVGAGSRPAVTRPAVSRPPAGTRLAPSSAPHVARTTPGGILRRTGPDLAGPADGREGGGRARRGHRGRRRGGGGSLPGAPAGGRRAAGCGALRRPGRSAAGSAAAPAAHLVLLGGRGRPLRPGGDGVVGVAAGARTGRHGCPAAHRARPLQDDPLGRLRGPGGTGPEGPSGGAACRGHRRCRDRSAGRHRAGGGHGHRRGGGRPARPLGVRLPSARPAAGRPHPAAPALPGLVRPHRPAGLRPRGGRPDGLPHRAAAAGPVVRLCAADRSAHRAGRVHGVRPGAPVDRGVRRRAGGLHAPRPAHRPPWRCCRPSRGSSR